MTEIYGAWAMPLLEAALVLKRLEEATLDRPRLAERDLRDGKWASVRATGAEFYGSDFSRSEWNGVELEGCNLKKAAFHGCSLFRVEFKRCDLIKADFSGSSLEECRVAECVGAHVDFSGCRISASHFRNSDLNRLRIVGSFFHDCLFEFPGQAGITGLREGSLRGSLFFRCRFEGECLDLAGMNESVFADCDFSGVDWNSIDSGGARFIACRGCPGASVEKPEETGAVPDSARQALRRVKEKTI